MKLPRIQFFDESIPPLWRKLSIGVLTTWAVLFVPMAICATKLMDTTSMDFVPPKGSDSAKAGDAMSQYFPSVQSTCQFAIVVEGDRVFPNPLVENYTYYVEEELWNYPKQHPGQWPDVVQYCAVGEYSKEKSRYRSCEELEEVPKPLIRQFLVSEDRMATIILILFTDPTGTAGLSATSGQFLEDFAIYLGGTIVKNFKEKFGAPEGYTARATGIMMLGIDGMDGSMSDMRKTDTVIIPFAFLIFTYYVRSIRLLLIPLATLGLSVVASFSAVYPIAKYSGLQFMTVVPQTMMSCCLALCLDYNLFILMRFRENVLLGFSIKDIIGTLVSQTCGHTILISGILIMFAWFGMCLIPAEPIMTQGLGSGIAVLLVVIVNVTFSPALLCLLPHFFKVQTTLPAWCRLGNTGRPGGEYRPLNTEQDSLSGIEHGSPLNAEPATEDGHENPLHPPSLATDEERTEQQEKSMWYRVAKLVQKRSIWVILAVVVVGAPFYCRAPEVKTTLDPFEFVPRSAPSVVAWRNMAEKFPPGLFLPYFVLVEDLSGRPGGLNTSEGYGFLEELSQDILEETNLANYPNPDSYLESIVRVPEHIRIGPEKVPMLMLCAPLNGSDHWDRTFNWHYLYNEEDGLMVPGSHFAPLIPERQRLCADAYKDLFHMQVSRKGPDANKATFINILTPFQPTGQEATVFMDQLFNLRDRFKKEYPEFKVFIGGGNTVSRDYNRIIDDSSLVMLACIMGFVVVLIYIAFRSLLIPFRMVITIGYTVATTFGVSYYVYQTSAFHWLFPYLKDYPGDALMWIVPTMAITITVALGMDYDVFLLTRIYEFRVVHAFDTDSSIIKGLTKTGAIITGAGIIMTVAFGGLLISSIVALNQFGMLLCVSVLLDTFVVRSLFVPATMFLAGEANWYPRNVPEGIYNEFHFADEKREDQ